jgi:long-chain fatty acid transport protein
MKRHFSLLIIAFILLTANYALATNGMNTIGFGARMVGMGGVSFAMKNDTNLMNTNPAGITSIPRRKIDLGTGILSPNVHFTNDLNDQDADKEMFYLPAAGVVEGLNGNKLSLGFGVYAQGGMGATYPDMKHDVFRQYDGNPQTMDDPLVGQEYHSNIGYLKFAPSVAYQITPKFSVGLAVNLGYASMEMKMPYSIDPAEMQGMTQDFEGNAITFGEFFQQLGYEEVTAYADMGDGVTATGFGGKLGIQYDLTEQWTIGASYTMESTLDFSGDATMNVNSQFGGAYERMVGAAMSMGMSLEQAQQYINNNLYQMGMMDEAGNFKDMTAAYDADIEFSWPQEFGVGIAFRPTETMTVATEVRWINWESAMEEFVMELSNGDNPLINQVMGTPDGNMTFSMPMNWEDQIVIALGTEYLATEKLTVRGGFNYGKNPVPEESILAIFPAIVESHVTLGGGYQLSNVFRLDVAGEYILTKEAETKESIIANEYDNSSNELGGFVFHITGSMGF